MALLGLVRQDELVNVA